MISLTTSIDSETAELRGHWRLLPPWKNVPWFQEMIVNEFRPPANLMEMQAALLREVAGFAAAEVPHYQSQFRNAGLAADGIQTPADLVRLPILTKNELIDEVDTLQAKNLPPGEKLAGWCKSSGTTGRPAMVRQTEKTWMMFAMLKAKECRWFRFDPALVLGELRLTSLLPAHPDGRSRDVSETVSMPRWRNAGVFFETGPAVQTSSERPVPEIVEWMREHRVAYLMSTPSVLEQLAFYCGDAADLPDLRGFLSISAQLTEGMRKKIESTFRVPVHQNYGLNEIGVVASRCAAGRYHVHMEHCLVEIVDDSGMPVPPGVSGRLVVTSLRNFAMPLLRYDTDDLAVLSEGPCPCGRTLPGFERIEGRYRRYAHLPEGTRQRVNVISNALTAAPADLTRCLRRYQVHQTIDGHFQLRLEFDGPIPEALANVVRQTWLESRGDARLELDILKTDSLHSSGRAKHLEFTSEFNPPEPSDFSS